MLFLSSNYTNWILYLTTTTLRSVPSSSPDLLLAAARWTRSKVFPSSSPPLSGPGHPVYQDHRRSFSDSDRPNFTQFGFHNEIILGFDNRVELWDFLPYRNPIEPTSIASAGGTLHLIGSIAVEGHVVAATPINYYNNKIESEYVILLQISRRKTIYFEVHIFGNTPSLFEKLALPPSSMGPPPFHVNVSDSYFAITSSTGSITLFNSTKLYPMPLSGIETTIVNGMPVVDVEDRWLIISPPAYGSDNGQLIRNSTSPSGTPKGPAIGEDSTTPVRLPPNGPLLERIISKISKKALLSAKMLGDAGVAGLKRYFNSHGQTISGLPPTSINGNMDRAPDSSTAILSQNARGNLFSPFVLNKLLFPTMEQKQYIEVIDIPTQTRLAIFAPPSGVSFVSMSPYDSILATVSSNGEFIYLWDLTFVPNEVGLIDKYTRGITHASVSDIIWSRNSNGFGVLTRRNGSLHWFNRKQDHRECSHTNPNRQAWILTGSNVIHAKTGTKVSEIVPNKGENNDIKFLMEETNVMVYTGRNVLQIVNINDGNCYWKYDLPSEGIPRELLPKHITSLEYNEELCEKDAAKLHKKVVNKDKDYLAHFEIETAEPMIEAYRDRRIQFSKFFPSIDIEGSFKIFGRPLEIEKLNFGRGHGSVIFEKDNDIDGLKRAMESILI